MSAEESVQDIESRKAGLDDCEDADLPSDFFDDFAKEDFMAGLNTIDTWREEEPEHERTSPTLDDKVNNVKDLRELLTNDKVDVPVNKEDSNISENVSNQENGKSSGKHEKLTTRQTRKSTELSDLDNYIKPGSRRDPDKTNQAIKKDKEVKVREYLARTLEGEDNLKPPGTELDDYMEKKKETQKAKRREIMVEPLPQRPHKYSDNKQSTSKGFARQSVKWPVRSQYDRYPHAKECSPRGLESEHKISRQKWQNKTWSPPNSPMRRSPARNFSSRNSPARHSPAGHFHARHSPTRRSPTRRSPIRCSPTRRSPARRLTARRSPARRSTAKHSPVRSSRRSHSRSRRSRSRHSRSGRSISHSRRSGSRPRRYSPRHRSRSNSLDFKKEFLYNQPMSGLPPNNSYSAFSQSSEFPVHMPNSYFPPPGGPGGFEFAGQNYNYEPPAPSLTDGLMGPMLSGPMGPPMVGLMGPPIHRPMDLNHGFNYDTPQPVPPPQPVGPPSVQFSVAQPLPVPAVTSALAISQDPLAQLLVEGKISREDYLKLTPNKGQPAPMLNLEEKAKLLSRCHDAVTRLAKLHLPNRLIINNQHAAMETKAIPPKYCSPLKRQPYVSFFFTTASSTAVQNHNRQLVESIISTMELQQVITKPKKKTASNSKDVGVQTSKPYCESCEIRRATTFCNMETSIDREHFSTSVHTEVSEKDLASSKAVFTPGGGMSENAPISLAHLTPAQLVSQLAARAKNLQQDNSYDPNKFVRRQRMGSNQGNNDPYNHYPPNPPPYYGY